MALLYFTSGLFVLKVVSDIAAISVWLAVLIGITILGPVLVLIVVWTRQRRPLRRTSNTCGNVERAGGAWGDGP